MQYLWDAIGVALAVGTLIFFVSRFASGLGKDRMDLVEMDADRLWWEEPRYVPGDRDFPERYNQWLARCRELEIRAENFKGYSKHRFWRR